MKNISVTIGTVLLLLFGFAVFNSQKQNNQNTIKPTEIITNSIPISPTVPPTQGTVPLPQATDIIRRFFSLIEARRINDAVGMMSDAITRDDSMKQAWGVQLNAIKMVKILNIEPSTLDEGQDIKHTYKVTLDMVMDPASSAAPIPYYGYENGINIRWITLEKTRKMWQIMGLATGP
jgi:hypothetical protein